MMQPMATRLNHRQTYSSEFSRQARLKGYNRQHGKQDEITPSQLVGFKPRHPL